LPQDFSSPIAWIACWPILIAVWVAYRGLRYWFTNRRRGLSLTETVLLFGVIVAGAGVIAAANLSAGFGRAVGLNSSDDVWTVTGNTYRYTETFETEVAEGANIEVFNLYGNVEIRPKPGNQLSLVVEKIVRAASREEADRMNRGFSFNVQSGPAGAVVRSLLDNSVRHAPREWFRSNLTLWVPPEIQARIVNRWGDVVVRGPLSVETDVQHGERINQ
jgi:hypothetical protein